MSNEERLEEKQMWEMIGNEMSRCQFSKYQIGYKRACVPMMHVKHNKIKNKIHKIRKMNSCEYHGDGRNAYYYITSEELILLLPHSSFIKCSDKHLVDIAAGDNIAEIIKNYRLKKYDEMNENRIIDVLVKLKAGKTISYKDKYKKQMLSFEEQQDEYEYINDALFCFPNDNNKHSISVIFSCNTLSISESKILGNTNILSTLFGFKSEAIANELAKHPLYDTEFQENIPNILNYSHDQFEKSETLKTLELLESLLHLNNSDWTENIASCAQALIHRAEAKFARLYHNKIDYIQNGCNVCGETANKANSVWLWCKKHGHCHSLCSEYGALSCQHC